MKSHYSSLGAAALAMATTATAFIKPPPPVAKTTMTEGFPWRNPFASSDISSFAPDCEVSKTFPASEYTLHDLFEMPPKGLWPWGEALKTFFQGRQYPGGWAGLDHHMYNRNLLMMEYADVPIRVREWIEEEDRSGGEGKGLFAVFAKPKEEGDTIEATVVPPEATAAIDRSLDKEKVAMFAPGAMYSILPLWVAEGSKCPDTLLDLKKYSAQPKDASVIAWPVSHKKPDKDRIERNMDFTIKAQLLRRTEAPVEADTKAQSVSEKEEL